MLCLLPWRAAETRHFLRPVSTTAGRPRVHGQGASRCQRRLADVLVGQHTSQAQLLTLPSLPQVERIRSLARSANDLHQHNDRAAATYLSDKLNNDLSKLSIEEAVPLTRALGHYLMLTQQAEIHHR